VNCERSFSELKIIESRLRSSIGNDRGIYVNERGERVVGGSQFSRNIRICEAKFSTYM